jgi:hypothetical protein
MKLWFRITGALLAVVASVPAQHNEHQIVFSNDTLVDSDIVIERGSACTIEQGVSIRFAGYHSFIIHGLLAAEATAEEPIVFSCKGRVRGSTDKPCWKGFEIVGEKSTAVFSHCRFEGYYRMLLWESSPVFDSCTFSGNHYALYCANKAKPHVSNSTFTGNVYAIAADFSQPLLLDNIITENDIGIYQQLGARMVIGRNIIEKNARNIVSEESLGSNETPLNIHYIWKFMHQLY